MIHKSYLGSHITWPIKILGDQYKLNILKNKTSYAVKIASKFKIIYAFYRKAIYDGLYLYMVVYPQGFTVVIWVFRPFSLWKPPQIEQFTYSFLTKSSVYFELWGISNDRFS